MEFFQQNWYIFLIGFIVLYLIFGIFMHKKYAAKRDQFFAENPTYSKILIGVDRELIHQTSIAVDSVDNELPTWHYTLNKNVIAISPGTHILEASASVTRPGVMHKSVTTTYGPVKLEVNIDPGCEYTLSFDRKEETFKLDKNN